MSTRRVRCPHRSAARAASVLRFECLERRDLMASLSIPQDLIAAPGETIEVPVELDSVTSLAAPNRLIGSDLIILFDNTVLTATAVTAGDFIASRPAWAFVESIENSLGAISIVAFTSAPLAGQFSGTLVNLHFTVNSDAISGATSINLAETFANKFTDLVDESDGFLDLEVPVTNAADDPVDGLVTIAFSDWRNLTNRLDVDNNGTVAALDVLALINEINLRRFIDTEGRLPAQRPQGQFFFDVTGEGILSPTDVLTIINFLNSGAEGEGSTAHTVTPALPHQPAESSAADPTPQGSGRAIEFWEGPAVAPHPSAGELEQNDPSERDLEAVDALFHGDLFEQLTI